jgi:preprotein translocase subunit SecD
MLEFSRFKITIVTLVCLFFMAAALPNAVGRGALEGLPDWWPKETVPLGLDLQGGSYLLLQLDFDTYLKEHMQNMRDALRSTLRREHRIGYTRAPHVTDGAVKVTLRPDTIPPETDIEDVLRNAFPDAQVDVAGTEVTIGYDDKALRNMRLKLLSQSIEIVNRRVNETGTKEPIIQRQGQDRIIVQVPGLQDPAELKRLLGKTAKMNFHMVNESVSQAQIERGTVPAGTRLLPHDKADTDMLAAGVRTPVYTEVGVSGELLTNAQPGFVEGQAVVNFTFNTLGARKFGEITSANIGKRFAVVLDGKIITAPVIRSAIIGGRGMIEGNFTVETANQLAILLRAGALPAPLDIIEERTVGPSLGQDSIDAGTYAAVAGLLLVAGFMVIAYGLFGVIANIALLVNIIIILGVLSLLQATLTLPGIAGIALTMGMAVDANVLIFERIRDEISLGKSALAAVDSGFKMAFGTILDSNITTLIAAALLFYFGSGTVKGFSVTLAVGILSSMFTAIMFTRMLIIIWIRHVRPKRIPI